MFLAFSSLTSLVLSPAFAAETLDPVYPAPAQRRAVEASARLLPRGVTAAPPATDGGIFGVLVEPGVYPVASTEDVRTALAEILPAFGLDVDVDALVAVTEGERKPMADLDALYAEGEIATNEWMEETERRIGTLSAESAALIAEEAKEAYDRASTPVQIWRLDQYAGRARLLGYGVRVQVDENGIRSITGALLGDSVADNSVVIDSATAARYAARYAGEGASVPDAPELVAVADGEQLLQAWRMTVVRDDLEYLVSVEAAQGAVIELQPLFWSAEDAVGRVAIPGKTLPVPYGVYGFGVDAVADCDYTLDHTGVLISENWGADGYTAEPTACMNASGDVDFDTFPTNYTTNLTDATKANYNGRFQMVNAYAWTYEALEYFEARGSGDLPEWEVNVNHNNPCNFGIDNACGTIGTLSLGIGSRMFGGTTGLYNTALDATVMLHEVGHGVNYLRYEEGGGILNDSVGEGLADYWAMSRLNTDIVGMMTKNTTADYEMGGLPRKADAVDVFPEHLLDYGSEPHANGQVLARALWEARTEMRERSPVGPSMTDTYLMDALPSAGSDQTGGDSELAVHKAYYGILMSMVMESHGTLALNDILVGFAKAGITTTSNEAVIDISENVLDADDTNPPSFQVWTGADFGWNGEWTDGYAAYNTQYEIEVASDEAFTQDVYASGVQTNVAVTDGVATATWNLPQEAWDALRKKNTLYYRVTTWDDAGGSERSSTYSYSYFLKVKPGRAILNHSSAGSACSTAGSGTVGGMGALLAMAALVRRRRA